LARDSTQAKERTVNFNFDDLLDAIVIVLAGIAPAWVLVGHVLGAV
jgi:hypothetical protein